MERASSARINLASCISPDLIGEFDWSKNCAPRTAYLDVSEARKTSWLPAHATGYNATAAIGTFHRERGSRDASDLRNPPPDRCSGFAPARIIHRTISYIDIDDPQSFEAADEAIDRAVESSQSFLAERAEYVATWSRVIIFYVKVAYPS